MRVAGFDDPQTEREYWLVQLLSEGMRPSPDTIARIRATRPLRELLQLLHTEEPAHRRVATAMLWTLWMADAGPWAEQQLFTGMRLIEQDRLAEAETLFTDVLSAHADFPEAYNKRATARFLAGEYALAIEDCRDALLRNPYHFGAWHGLGLCYEALGNYGAAAEAFAQALSIQPYAGENRRRLAHCRARLRSEAEDC